jgi:hypothetical protein
LTGEGASVDNRRQSHPIAPKKRLLIPAFERIAIRFPAALVVTTAVMAIAATSFGVRAVPLAAPILLSPGGKSHADVYVLKGKVDSVRPNSWVRILRNGLPIDSVSVATDTLFSKQVPLLVGDNSLRAVLYLGTSVSPGSNFVNVHFDDRAGFFVPTPFVPGASFDVNPVETAVKVELRIFDTTGDLVVRFESREPRVFYSFPWDGKNGSYQSVRRGPLVAVGAIDYPDGTHDVIRQVFLFDPEGSP